METPLLPIFAMAGYMGASILATLLMRWGTLVWVSLQSHGGDFVGAPRHRLLWAFPFVALLHPAPYILIAVVLIFRRLIHGGVGPPLVAVLLGVGAYSTIVGVGMLKATRLRGHRKMSAP